MLWTVCSQHAFKILYHLNVCLHRVGGASIICWGGGGREAGFSEIKLFLLLLDKYLNVHKCMFAKRLL